MNRCPRPIEIQLRHAFGLLLAIRARREAPRLLNQAIAFLEILGRDPGSEAPAAVVCIRAVPIRKPRARTG